MKKALIIGIDHYNDPIKNLHSGVAGAREIGNILNVHYAKEGKAEVPNFSCKVLTSSPCDYKKTKISRAVLKENLFELFEDDEADSALLFFSGYAFENSLGGYLMTQDASEHEEGVAFDDVMTYANNSSIKDITIILDGYTEEKNQLNEPNLSKSNHQKIETAALRKGVSILTVETRLGAANFDSGQGRFADLLCHVLESGGDDDVLGHVTLAEFYAIADRILAPLGHQVVFKSNAARLTVLRHANPQIDYAILQKMKQYFPDKRYKVPLFPECLKSQGSTNEKAIRKYKNLQKMVRCGLVEPINEEHMYYAALHKKHCGRTEKGLQYWYLVESGQI